MSRTLEVVLDQVGDAMGLDRPRWVIKSRGEMAVAELNDGSLRIVCSLREDGYSLSSYTHLKLDRLIQNHNARYERHPVNAAGVCEVGRPSPVDIDRQIDGHGGDEPFSLSKARTLLAPAIPTDEQITRAFNER